MTPAKQETRQDDANTNTNEPNDQDQRAGDRELRLHLPCEIQSCAHVAAEVTDHPQRGDFRACHTHAYEIEKLPAWRWIGRGSGA